MSETPFQLTARQALRVTAEFLGLILLVSLGTKAAIHLLEQTGFNVVSDELWETVFVNSAASTWVVVRTLRRHRVSLSLVTVWGFKPGGTIAPFLLLVLGTGLVVSDLNNLLEAWHPIPDWLRTAHSSGVNFPVHPLGAFVALAVVAPLTEESIFRGLVLRGLLGAGPVTRAILISAALFGLMHLNPWQIPGAFADGLIFGWAYLRTRSLGLCAIGHALHNLIVLFSATAPFTISGFNTVNSAGQVSFQPWWLNLSGVALTAIGAVWFHRAAPAAQNFPGFSPPALPPVPVLETSSTTPSL